MKTKKILLLTSVAVGLITLFQNCGPNNALLQDESISSLVTQPSGGNPGPDPADFRYKRATPVYFEFHMVPRAANEASQYQEYDLVAVASMSDGREVNLPYEIEVVDRNNMAVCLTRTGILAATFTRIQETCAKRKTSVIAKATMRIKTPNGVWHEYVQNYDE